MPRCLPTPLAALALSASMLLPLMAPASAQAQAARVLPTYTLRGKLAFGQAPEASLNGESARLAPGVRIRGTDNMLLLSGAVTGQTYQVNYALELNGLIKEVWILTEAEIAKTWPQTAQEASTWSYDGISQSWTKP